MKSALTTLTLALFLILLAGGAWAQDTCPGDGTGDGTGSGNGVCQFVDEDGDGFNDLAPDADGDGIPNGLDPDFVRPEDGDGNQYKYGVFGLLFSKSFLNSFGEDASGERNGAGSGFGYGPGDGTGVGSGPADGTGFGPGNGTGECDPDGDATSARNQRRGGRS